ncbi:hypothetical protein B2J93_8171 [Marssonina coronariae]|uniref:Protein Zds1 C-terminal domain-containing protein n=1 Tax=Diplocarpon coronariae TaxID=2795749 RepID=A0A218YTS7_9HELO|nr:hypothetical protein B2J93_8171 [Marssonina coronariae]
MVNVLVSAQFIAAGEQSRNSSTTATATAAATAAAAAAFDEDEAAGLRLCLPLLHASPRPMARSSLSSIRTQHRIQQTQQIPQTPPTKPPIPTSSLTTPLLQTSSRPREVGGNYASRRGHAPQQLSISDTNHHVTEAIGDMYGEDDYPKRDSRPLSFMPSLAHDSIESGIFVNSPSSSESVDAGNTLFDGYTSSRIGPAPYTNGNARNPGQMSPAILHSATSASFHGGELSPTLSRRERDLSDPANAQFQLNSIDYESDPAAVAQELSNLQALRRMSMDVGHTSDPDLPSFQGGSLMPSKAPTGDDDNDDPSRLFWVPARVHPELAPMEFKTFLENRVQSIKRRSGEQQPISPDGSEQGDSGGGLRRKKSMLSRQINHEGGRGVMGYKDGADHPERKNSPSIPPLPELKISDLKELDDLGTAPSTAMQNLALDPSARQSGDGEVSTDADMPILSQAPRMGLRRSTKTTYRRGSLRKEGRGSRRAGTVHADTEGDDPPGPSPIDGRIGYPLAQVQSEPSSTENFSRPSRGGRRVQNIPRTGSDLESTEVRTETGNDDVLSVNLGRESAFSPQQGVLPRNNTFPRSHTPVPRIIETPPAEEVASPPATGQTHQFPGRPASSQGPATQQQHQIPETPTRSNRRPNPERQNSSQPVGTQVSPPQSRNRLSRSPSPLPGNKARTDSLAPTPAADERKPEKRSKKEKEEPEHSGSRKTSWGWFKDGDKKEKKEKKKEDDYKRSKAKTSLDKAHDNARLDVLQSTLDTAAPRGRPSQLLERDTTDHRLHDERKKESSRKPSSENKKEKDGLFSSFFGGGKKKGERDSGGKKGSSLRTLSPEPPPRQLRADIDYNWTRFSILEERAIYRMAHIKLANPRRALYSQVLLSNFMYSYLAKVQQMHPQMQIPQSALQKKQEAERKHKELEQQRQQQQQQQQEGGDHYKYDYHLGITQYVDPGSEPKVEGAGYADGPHTYDQDHHDDSSHGQHPSWPRSHVPQHKPQQNGYGDQGGHGQHDRNGKDYYQQQKRDDDDDDDEMW